MQTNRIVVLAGAVGAIALAACSAGHAVAPSLPPAVPQSAAQSAIQAQTPNVSSVFSRLRIVHIFHLPSGTAPSAIALGSDGNMWFTQEGPLTVGRITPAGQVTFFPASTRDFENAITRGPSNDLWVTAFGFPEIDRITTLGKVTPFFVQGNPSAIVTGHDGNLWYTDFTLQAVGMITPGGTFKEFPVPTKQAGPFGISRGPDGNIWFTELLAGKIGRITPAGVVTEFTPPGPAAQPAAIATAHDNLYATDLANASIIQSTLAGIVTTYQSPIPLHFSTLLNDREGKLIVGATTEGMIGLFDTGSHKFSDFISIPKSAGQQHAGPNGLALSPKGEMWFTSTLNDYIGVVEDRSR